MSRKSVYVKGLDTEMIPSGEAGAALTVADSAVALALTLGYPTTHVYWTVDGADIRVRFDGTDPDANTGHLLRDGSSGMWHRNLAKAAKMIRTAATSAQFFATPVCR